jgi:hypothetical protein
MTKKYSRNALDSATKKRKKHRMKELKEQLERELSNTDKIYLYTSAGTRGNEFWVLYERSAYLFRKYFWADIQVLIKVHNKDEEYLQVGFPKKSWHERVEVTLTQHSAWRCQNLKSLEPSRMIAGMDGVTEGDFAVWKKLLLDERADVVKQMQPFYGGLPLYKVAYGLMDSALAVMTEFPINLRSLLGKPTVGLLLEVEMLLRDIYLEKTDQRKLELLSVVQVKVDQMAFLLRIAFDQRAYGVGRGAQFVGAVGEIKRQITLWSKKLAKH